jgi:DNA-binding transcriptional MerR regulator
MSTNDNIRRYTAMDIEALTQGIVDRKVTENWHNRDLWLTPSDSPPRGKPRLYSVAHLFEALTRAALIDSGFSHAAARTAIELRLADATLEKERKKQRRGRADSGVSVLASNIAREIFGLPELKKPNEDWYWAIYSRGNKESELGSTIAFKGDVSVADLCSGSKVASVVHISEIVRDVFAFVEQRTPNG